MYIHTHTLFTLSRTLELTCNSFLFYTIGFLNIDKIVINKERASKAGSISNLRPYARVAAIIKASLTTTSEIFQFLKCISKGFKLDHKLLNELLLYLSLLAFK